MHSVHNVESLNGQKHSLVPLRVTVVQPSAWERLKAKVDRVLSQAAVAEAVFGAVTVVLTAGIVISLARAVAHYTIIPIP